MAGVPPQFQALTIRSTGGLASQIITDLEVSLGFDPNAPPQPLPPREATKALWDTGASKSVISQDLAQSLNLTAVGAANVHHAGGSNVSPTHVVNFYLPNLMIFGILVTEFPGQPKFGAIVGMDVITVGDFAVTNVGGTTCMSFRTPTTETIDYVLDFHRKLKAAIGRNDPCPCGSGQKFKKCHGK